MENSWRDSFRIALVEVDSWRLPEKFLELSLRDFLGFLERLFDNSCYFFFKSSPEEFLKKNLEELLEKFSENSGEFPGGIFEEILGRILGGFPGEFLQDIPVNLSRNTMQIRGGIPCKVLEKFLEHYWRNSRRINGEIPGEYLTEFLEDS